MTYFDDAREELADILVDEELTTEYSYRYPVAKKAYDARTRKAGPAAYGDEKTFDAMQTQYDVLFPSGAQKLSPTLHVKPGDVVLTVIEGSYNFTFKIGGEVEVNSTWMKLIGMAPAESGEQTVTRQLQLRK